MQPTDSALGLKIMEISKARLVFFIVENREKIDGIVELLQAESRTNSDASNWRTMSLQGLQIK